MPAVDYPFIQIAVLPEVREKFAAGQALVILSPSLDFIYWANGAAATLFGYPSIYAFLDDQAFGDTVTGRQIAATAMQLGPTRARQNLLLRLGTGFRRFAAACTLEMLTLPGGEEALLLAMPADARLKDSIARAAAMIEGFGEIETHVAVIDDEANTLAASPSFPAIGLEPAVMEQLVADVDRERSRLVKRVVTTARGRWPAAVAKLIDSPPLYLLFAVEPDEDVQPHPVAADDGDDPRAQAASPAPAAAPMPTASGSSPDAPPSGFTFNPDGRPVRFVWKIDAEGRFSELSPEFADAVGPAAADAIGRTFEELAKVFNLDPEEKISELLRRRDTWSGKTVLWPVQGEALSVPVDLAALPTYTRDRTFDGFRGFGIVRIADAVPDPEKIGLALIAEPVDFDATAGTTDLPLPEAPVATEELTVPSFEDRPSRPSDDTPTVPPAAANTDHRPTSGPPDVNGTDAPEADPFRGEIPVLRLIETPARRASDKVIDLQEHRTRGAREGLSKADQAVFQQIGAELGKRLGDADDEDSEEAAKPNEAAAPHGSDIEARVEGTSFSPKPNISAAEPVAAVELLRPSRPEPVPAAEFVSAVALDVALVAKAEDQTKADEQEREAAAATFGQAASQRAQLTAGFLDNLPLAALIHRGDQLVRANEAFYRLTGYGDLAELEFAGGIGALFPERSGASVADDHPDDVELARFDGTTTPCQARLQSVGWDDGHALMLTLSPSEISRPSQPLDDPETSEASLALAMVEMEELRSILETATDGVVILDETGNIRSVNRSASALFDYDDSELTGQPFAMLFAPESQRAVLDYVSSLTDNGVASVLNDGREVMAREASGGIIPIFMTLGRLTGSNGFCAVLRDITHWKRTEEDLRTAKRAAETANAHKSDFLARVSHEIRTPLNAIIGFAEMMATERFGPIGNPRYQEYAHDIGRSGRHVLDIVNDLLDISKIEAGQLELDFSAVSLNDALAESVSLLQPQANGQRVIIRTSLSASLPEVVADARSIRQIALNLLSNAIRFTPAGGQIVVSTAYEPSGRVIIRVRDTGTGMTRSELEQAMKPFRQASASAARPRGDGTGLGLPLTKAMVEANRAQFTIESAPGEGTLVEIAFPPQRVLAD